MNHDEQQAQIARNETLVAREVHARVSTMAEFILNASSLRDDGSVTDPPFSWDDVENQYDEKTCESCGGVRDEEESYCETCDAPTPAQPNDIYEWWIVSPWLLAKLKAEGEPVIEHEQLWGRCTSGQAIALDSVISKIQRATQYGEGAE